MAGHDDDENDVKQEEKTKQDNDHMYYCWERTYKTGQVPNQFDTTYGLRYNSNGELLMGKVFVYLSKNSIGIGTDTGEPLGKYSVRISLLELLFNKRLPKTRPSGDIQMKTADVICNLVNY